MGFFDSVSSYAIERISQWWEDTPSSVKLTILAALIGSILLMWVIGKVIAFSAKVILTVLFTGGVIFIIVSQTGNMALWLSIFPDWESYSFWKKAEMVAILGGIVSLSAFAVIKISKKTLFSPKLTSRKKRRESIDQCKALGGVYDFKKSVCRFD